MLILVGNFLYLGKKRTTDHASSILNCVTDYRSFSHFQICNLVPVLCGKNFGEKMRLSDIFLPPESSKEKSIPWFILIY